MSRHIYYVIDLYDSALLKATESRKAADRKARSHVRRTGHTCGVAQLVAGFQAER